MAYNESILHTVGRAVGSGAWQGVGARAVQAFQNAQRIAMARKGMEQDEAFRQQKFTADQDFRTNVVGPSTLQNAQSRAIGADASRLNSQTRAADFLDEVSGGQVRRGALQSQASKAPLGEVPNLLAIDPNQITGPGAIEAFKKAQEAEHRKAVREHAAKQSINKKTDIETHAFKDTFSRLNERTIGPKKEAGLPGDEWTRRNREQLKTRLISEVAKGNIDADLAARMLQHFDQTGQILVEE